MHVVFLLALIIAIVRSCGRLYDNVLIFVPNVPRRPVLVSSCLALIYTAKRLDMRLSCDAPKFHFLLLPPSDLPSKAKAERLYAPVPVRVHL